VLDLIGGRTRTRTLDPLIKSHLQLVSLQWPFRQNVVHVALDIVGRLTPVGMSVALIQRTSFERTEQLLPSAERL
jgi:hypothetical protein